MLSNLRLEPSRGQALVEFALVIPVFLVILMGTIDLGRAVFAYNSVTNAAREEFRVAIVNQDVNLIRQRATAQSAIAEASRTKRRSSSGRRTECRLQDEPHMNAYNAGTRPMDSTASRS